MDSSEDLKPGGSGILPQKTHPKFFMRHFSAYNFAVSYVKVKDVLEIGFGDGYGADFLAGSAKNIKAIDVLGKNVDLASSKYKRPNLQFKEMSAVDLDFGDESFDVVVSFQVIEHIPEKLLMKYLEEIKRVLNKSGIAFISTLNLVKNKKPDRPYNKNPFHVREFDFEGFDGLIKKVFDRYEIMGLFCGARLRFFDRLKKIGIFRFLPRTLNIVDRYYDNITADDFVWKKENLSQCIDFMAVCKKA
ncbi:MAG: class I SAM-dependent methyltransferase [Candidatus Omnitrophica bacterium]|nr:class I SAM-dependent methyltransferase [Candidatus Omnitrophota bacterium]